MRYVSRQGGEEGASLQSSLVRLAVCADSAPKFFDEFAQVYPGAAGSAERIAAYTSQVSQGLGIFEECDEAQIAQNRALLLMNAANADSE